MLHLAAIQNSHDLLPALYESLLGFVSDDRKQRVKKFFRREDACRSIVGEVLAKYSVGKAAGVPPDTISFRVDSFGKPHAILEKEIQLKSLAVNCEASSIPREDDLLIAARLIPEPTPRNALAVEFSISHSGSWVVCAVDEGPVGVDVERVRKYDPDIAKRFYHPNEYAAISALPEHERTGRFFDLWTIKESYIKAIGKGLSQSLDGFEILFENGMIRMQTTSGLQPMHFKQYDLGPEYKCAVCADHEEFPEEITIMTPEQLWEEVDRQL
jgi:4'-phosphopantetheinyl transferase